MEEYVCLGVYMYFLGFFFVPLSLVSLFCSILFWWYFDCFILLLFFQLCIWFQTGVRTVVVWDGWEDEEKLRIDGGGETIRIYCTKNLISVGKNRKEKTKSNRKV